MHPILARFDIAGTTLTLYAYSTFLVLAAVVALALAARGATRPGVPRRRALAWYGLAIAAGLVGARLLDAALDWGPYAEDPGRIVAIEARGFALFGGLAGGLLVALLAARAWRVSPWMLADSAIPAVAVGIVLLRVGCFLNGCCAGTPTDLPWGISFPSRGLGLDVQLLEDTGLLGLSGLSDASAPVHPTQLYEAGAALVCCALALLLRQRSASPGTAALVFATGFALFRAANQLLRPPAPTASVPEWLLPLFYLGVGAVSAAVLAVRWRASAAAAASPGSQQWPLLPTDQVQSPKQVPTSFPVSTRGCPTGTSLMRSATSVSGRPTISLPRIATILPKSPEAMSWAAAVPKLVARTRS